MPQSVERFSSRVADYVKYRPGYPSEILQLLKTECGLTPQSVIADIGSGTGKLSEVFLANGNVVIGVEPNAGMRAAAEDLLRSYSGFRSVEGSAEDSTLPERSVDFVTAAQAFHWFNPELAKLEASRILKPDGWAALVWNHRKLVATPFLEDYEALLLRFGTDYKEVRHDKAEGLIAEFFAPASVSLMIFPNNQVFDFSGLKGRVRSSSYTPEPGHPDFEAMMLELKTVFEKHEQNGRVTFDYDTKVYYGHLPGSGDVS
jgi:SAM-dependent methyltransferase